MDVMDLDGRWIDLLDCHQAKVWASSQLILWCSLLPKREQATGRDAKTHAQPGI